VCTSHHIFTLAPPADVFPCILRPNSVGAAPMHSRQQQNSHSTGRQSGGRRRIVAIAPAPSTSSSAIPPPSNPRRNYASPDDWEAHRDTITRLYYYEEMTLREVKKHMEMHHDFLAT
jgi:hypothetical protein